VLSGKRLRALWNALPDVEKRRKVGHHTIRRRRAAPAPSVIGVWISPRPSPFGSGRPPRIALFRRWRSRRGKDLRRARCGRLGDRVPRQAAAADDRRVRNSAARRPLGCSPESEAFSSGDICPHPCRCVPGRKGPGCRACQDAGGSRSQGRQQLAVRRAAVGRTTPNIPIGMVVSRRQGYASRGGLNAANSMSTSCSRCVKLIGSRWVSWSNSCSKLAGGVSQASTRLVMM
jgi:hypothetical protein